MTDSVSIVPTAPRGISASMKNLSILANSQKQRPSVNRTITEYPQEASAECPHAGTDTQKPLHSVYNCVQRNAGPHRCRTLSVVREIIPPDVHRLALRHQQLLSNLARVRL